MENEIQIRENFKKALRDFNFERVYTVMKFLDWKWVGSLNGVPSIEEMKKEVERLFEDLIKNPGYVCAACGGFQVRVAKKSITIQFILTESYREYD